MFFFLKEVMRRVVAPLISRHTVSRREKVFNLFDFEGTASTSFSCYLKLSTTTRTGCMTSYSMYMEQETSCRGLCYSTFKTTFYLLHASGVNVNSSVHHFGEFLKKREHTFWT